MEGADFQWDLHQRFFRRMASELPPQYISMETNRLTLLYFCVSGLDLLGHEWTAEENKSLRAFIYSHQDATGGFDGGGLDKAPHIANTYTALCILAILNDDFSLVRRDLLSNRLKEWQQADGSFVCVTGNQGGEQDMRFCFCASAIAKFLNLWSAFDVNRLVNYILRSQSYDGAIGMGPSLESHGGSTYCGLAALSLAERLDDLPNKERLITWLCRRQVGGFQGRIGKPPDSCYSFWIAASLELVGHGDLVNREDLIKFLKVCEGPRGGFPKYPNTSVDVLHSYLSIAGLALADCISGVKLHSGLNISQRAASSLQLC
eukprot:GEMP01042172.1.p1 GENE.GEMP01042172.1~~GEMP01042172.1.p1  ORF type:complete len:318 (+),score=53.53 GEMP01042172.1:110-1063(+)